MMCYCRRRKREQLLFAGHAAKYGGAALIHFYQQSVIVSFLWLKYIRLDDKATVGCKSFGRNIRLGFKQQQQDLIYNHLCLRK